MLNITNAALLCLALNVYYESNTEPVEGKYAVAHVTLNRAKEQKKDICTIVYQPNQFSWTLSPKPKPLGVGWTEAKQVAGDVARGNTQDLTCGATFFHADYVKKPDWAKSKKRVLTIGRHIFYTRPSIAPSEDINYGFTSTLSLTGIFHPLSTTKFAKNLPLHKPYSVERRKELFYRTSGCGVLTKRPERNFLERNFERGRGRSRTLPA